MKGCGISQNCKARDLSDVLFVIPLELFSFD